MFTLRFFQEKTNSKFKDRNNQRRGNEETSGNLKYTPSVLKK